MASKEIDTNSTSVVLTDSQSRHAQELLELFQSGEYYTPNEVQEREQVGLPIDRPELNVYKFNELWEQFGPGVKVRVPVVLRHHTQSQSEVTIVPSCERGASVGGVLVALATEFPGVNVLNAEGEVLRYVSIYKEGEDIRFLGGLACPVEYGDVVSIIPAVAGGA